MNRQIGRFLNKLPRKISDRLPASRLHQFWLYDRGADQYAGRHGRQIVGNVVEVEAGGEHIPDERQWSPDFPEETDGVLSAIPAFSTFRRWNFLPENLPKVQLQIREAKEPHGLVPAENIRTCTFSLHQTVPLNGFVLRVNKQIFPYAETFIEHLFLPAVLTSGSGREYFNRQVRCPLDVRFGNFAFVAYDKDVRLNYVGVVENYIGRCYKRFTSFSAKKTRHGRTQVSDNALMGD